MQLTKNREKFRIKYVTSRKYNASSNHLPSYNKIIQRKKYIYDKNNNTSNKNHKNTILKIIKI